MLDFVRSYILRWSDSPSVSEIAAGVDISRSRVKQHLRALVKSGQLLRRPGPRGLLLPELRDEAVRQLRELGWSVDEALLIVRPPCPDPTLPPLVTLDYLPIDQEVFGDGYCEGDTAETG